MERSMKATQEHKNCQMNSEWWAICYWLKKKKKVKPTKDPTQKCISKGQNSAWHWTDTLLSHLIWKSAWEFEKDRAVYVRGAGFVPVSPPFHCPTEDKVRGQRMGTPLWFHAAKGRVWREKRSALCKDWEKPMYWSTYRCCLRVTIFFKAGQSSGELPPCFELFWGQP